MTETAPSTVPATPNKPDVARWLVWGVASALVAGTLGYFWWNQHLIERCSEVGYRSVIRSPPPTPSEMSWYLEHCWNGAPR